MSDAALIAIVAALPVPAIVAPPDLMNAMHMHRFDVRLPGGFVDFHKIGVGMRMLFLIKLGAGMNVVGKTVLPYFVQP